MKNNFAKIVSIILTIIVLTATFTGCSSSSLDSSNATNTVIYSDYSFWHSENQLRITLPVNFSHIESNSLPTGIGELTLSNKYLKKVEKLKLAIINYFQEVYNIDVSEKLNKQELRAFSASEFMGDLTMGYVDPTNQNILNLNIELFNDYKKYFNNTYVHETLHQLGFLSEDSTMITEGIVDALTDLILCKANIQSSPTDTYFDVRILGYQIIATDTYIAEFYLNNSNTKMAHRITTALKEVKRTYKKVRNIGKRLEDLCTGLTYGISGTVDPYFVAFEAQEIVRAYCQTFNPSTETIDYIRSHYLIEDYESVTIVPDGNGFQFFI